MYSVVWSSQSERGKRTDPSVDRPQWGWLLFWLAAVATVALVGANFTPGAWYEQLRKPSFNPPAVVFGPVWSLLYLLMAVAAWLVARAPAGPARRKALLLMSAQLLLNALWSPLFFGLHSPGWAFVDISALWIVLAATLIAFSAVRTMAAWLLVPYLLWVSFALVLNGSIWLMNSAAH